MNTDVSNKEIVEIDASGRRLGRLASEIAVKLLGKDRLDYAPNKVMPVEVRVKNAHKLDIPPKRMKEKEYQRHSGYPGGRKIKTMEEVIEDKGYGEVIRHAVRGMLPKNRLQKKRMQHLIIEEEG